MPWSEDAPEPAKLGDRVISIPTQLHGTITDIAFRPDGRWEFTVQLDGERFDLTILTAPPSHFIPEEPVPVDDPVALQKWLDS